MASFLSSFLYWLLSILLMSKRPSSTIFYVFLSIFILFGFYVFGSLIWEARDNENIEETSQKYIQQVPSVSQTIRANL